VNLLLGAPYHSSGATTMTRAWVAQALALRTVPVQEAGQELRLSTQELPMASTVVVHLLEGMPWRLATMAVAISPGMVLVVVATSAVVARAKAWAKVEKVAP